MARRKPTQPELAAAPPPPPPPPAAAWEVPRLIHYQPPDAAEPWQVERCDILLAELSLEVHSPEELRAALRQFHAALAPHPRQWTLIRRLCGIGPVVPAASAHPDDLRLWTRAELTAEGFAVPAELDALRVLWREHLARTESARAPETTSTALAPPPGELALDDAVLERFQFSERIFRINVWDPTAGENGHGAEVPRSDAENRAERTWFVRRVHEWHKMLDDPMGGPVARTALMNDLYLRRMETEIAVAPASRRNSLYEQKTALAGEYGEAIDKLQEMFPDMGVAGRVSFRAVISDLVLAHQDYYGRADRRRVDKVSTAAEIEFQLRTSLQVGQRHRFSLSLAIMENVVGLYDPEFRPQFKPGVLKQIDAAVKAARDAVAEIESQPVVDLERGVAPGEGDQFEDFNNVQCPACGRWRPDTQPRCPYCRKEG